MANNSKRYKAIREKVVPGRAYVLADALTSVLAIAALLAGRYLGWVWMDPVMGLVGAVVIAKSADDVPDVNDLHAFARENLAAFKTPAVWYYADVFPFTETGKLQKFKLIDAIKEERLHPVSRVMETPERRTA